MTDEPPARAEPDPVQRRTGRTVPPIIDLKAHATKNASDSGSSSGQKEKSSSMFHRQNVALVGPSVLGALAGAIAGMVAAFLIIALPTKTKDDTALRLATLEANQSLFSTADRSSALEQQTRNFDKKFVTLDDSIARQNQKNAELADAQKALSDALISVKKTIEAQSGPSPQENLSGLSKQIDALNERIDQLKAEPPAVTPHENSKLATALVLLLTAKDHVLNNQSMTRQIGALKTLNLPFIMADDLKSLEAETSELPKELIQKTQNQTSQNSASIEWSDRLWLALSRLVTISSVEERSNIKTSTAQDIRLKTIDRMIDLIMDHLIMESAAP